MPPLRDCSTLVGRGFERLIIAAFGEIKELEKKIWLFKHIMRTVIMLNLNHIMEFELLQELKRKNYKIGVCTNKGHRDAVVILNHFSRILLTIS